MKFSSHPVQQHTRLLVISMLILLLTCVTATAKMYKWVDKEGTTHYTQHPPIEQDSTQLTESSKPATSPESDSKKSTTAKSVTTKKSGKQAAMTAKRRAQCMHVKKNLGMLEKSLNIVRKRVKGKLVAMSETERKQLIGQYRATISQHCQ